MSKEWMDAVSRAMSLARSNGETTIGFPKPTNEQASGLILFAQEVAAYAAKQGRPVTFDSYGYALPALHWEKTGDQFDLSPKWRGAFYPAPNELWSALLKLAEDLDGGNIPFKLVRDPSGTSSTFSELAKQAWAAMQRDHPVEAAASTAAAKKAAAAASDSTARSPSDSTTAAAPKPKPKDPEQSASNGGAILLALLGAWWLSEQ